MIFCCCVQSMQGARNGAQRITDGQGSNPSNYAFYESSDGVSDDVSDVGDRRAEYSS